jgi:hypothetical protein
MTTARIYFADHDLVNHGLLEMRDTAAGSNTVEVRRTTGANTGIIVNANSGRFDVLRGGIRDIRLPVTNNGTFATNTTVTMYETFTQSTGGTLEIGLGGLAVGSQYGRLSGLGAINYDGTLALRLIDGFTPSPGDMFTVVTAATLNGDVGDVETIDFPVTLGAEAGRVGNTIVVEIVSKRGDMNNDGVVDALDAPLFAAALLDPDQCMSPACFLDMADLDESGVGDGDDLQLFIDRLLAP